MKLILFMVSFFLVALSALYAETNTTKPQPLKTNSSVKHQDNNDTNHSKAQRIAEKVKEQMELEKKYAKEQKFYQGDAYDLKVHEVDPDTLSDVKVIEPDYDFDITDVYRDDI